MTPEENLKLLQDEAKKVDACTQCILHEGRTNTVYGSGNILANIMIIGEAPGETEDAEGIPFVGKAGKTLDRWLSYLGVTREDVFICNIVKCRPPKNRKPHIVEIEKCIPYLQKQIELIKPKFILALGATAANTILDNTLPMHELRGKKFDGVIDKINSLFDITVFVTYHPAALLYKPELEKVVIEDLQTLAGLIANAPKRS